MDSDEHGRGTGRTRALAAARKLFSEHGYDAVSIQDVLSTSQLSRGALYHHFTNKAELFTAVLEDVEQDLLTRLEAQAAETASAREAVRAGALGFLNQTLDPVVRGIVLINAPAALGWARWREIDSHYAFGALRAGLEYAITSGELTLEADLVESYAHILLAALMEMGLLIAQSDNPQVAHERASRSVDQLINDLWARHQ